MKTFLTQEGMEKLRSDILHLKNVVLKECIQDIADARDKGDLSENAEYEVAKENFEKVNAKISELNKLLSTATVINKETIDIEKIQILNTVVLLNKNTNKEITYTIVPHIETNIKEGKISINSPVAQSLVGKKIGETAIAQIPSGQLEFEILDIKL